MILLLKSCCCRPSIPQGSGNTGGTGGSGSSGGSGGGYIDNDGTDSNQPADYDVSAIADSSLNDSAGEYVGLRRRLRPRRRRNRYRQFSIGNIIFRG